MTRQHFTTIGFEKWVCIFMSSANQLPMVTISNKLFKVLLAFLLIVSICCKHKQSSDSKYNWDKQNLRNVDVTDSAYMEAIKIARDNIPFFIKLLKDRKNNKFQYFIKSRFEEGNNIEHMWLIVDSIANNTFIATLDNVPDKLKKVKLNDRLKINKQDVEDWMIYKKDSLMFGNFISHSLDK